MSGFSDRLFCAATQLAEGPDALGYDHFGFLPDPLEKSNSLSLSVKSPSVYFVAGMSLVAYQHVIGEQVS